jgi:hypothetical protein
MSKKIKPNNQDNIIQNVYRKEIDLLNNINEIGILPYLTEEIISYISEFFISTTDYIDYYIEKIYKIRFKHSKLENNFDLEILPYIITLHNNPNKEEICKNWNYGEEFLLISERHEDGKAFYFSWNNWEKSFLCDLKIQINCISKPRSEIIDKKLLEYIMPINKILRIDYVCGMRGNADKWEEELGPYFQKIINMNIKEQTELFSIWNHEYVECFKFAIKDHQNGKKEYFSDNPNTSWLCSFITDFMMCLYH